MANLGERLKRLDDRCASAPAVTQPAVPAANGWIALAVLSGVALAILVGLSTVWEPVLAFLAVPVGIVFGWVMGRLYENKAASAGRGVDRHR